MRNILTRSRLYWILGILPLFISCPSLFSQGRDTLITIHGKNFAPGVEVFYNGQKLDNVDRVSSRELRVRIPLSSLITAGARTKNSSEIASQQFVSFNNSIEVRNPSPSRGSAFAEIAVVQNITGDYLGKWNQRNIKFLINNTVPREIITEIATAIQAFNDVGMNLTIELDTLNLTPLMPGEIPICGKTFDTDGKNIVGIRLLPRTLLGQFMAARGIVFPELCDAMTLRDPKRRIIVETDVAINKAALDSNFLKIGVVTDAVASNITWIIAHEIGHCLGLSHSPDYEEINGELVRLTWESSLMISLGRPTRWLGSIPDRERRLLKALYGSK